MVRPKPNLRTRTVSTKVTEEEHAELERTAQAAGKNLGEWCREVLLAGANRQLLKDHPADGTEAQALMAEFIALRTILLNVFFRVANDEVLTAEQMQQLIERADADKLKKALERLQRSAKSAGD